MNNSWSNITIISQNIINNNQLHIDPLIFRVEGEGGKGGSVVGEILARSAARAGFHIQCSRAFPAEIKGGRAWFQFKVSSEPQTWWGGTPDIEMIDGKGGEWVVTIRHKDRIDENGCPVAVKAPISFLSVANEIGEKRSPNLVALGFIAGTLGLDRSIVLAVAEKRLSRRGDPSPSIRLAILAGYEKYGVTSNWYSWQIAAKGTGNPHLILNGNEAITLGALAAGIRFFCGYPITPASSILETMLAELPKLGGTALQMEDEMAAFAAALGASYAGTKVMVATSGPGFALMSEMMNLATIAELPITIVDVQRSGPATGQPTKSEQADLLYALHGSPGDSPRLVLAPATVEEAFYLTIEAVNLAEKYQIPVVLLSDGALANRIEAIAEPEWDSLPVQEREKYNGETDERFERFADSATGVSKFAIPGTDDLPYIAGGMEHSATGTPSSSAEGHFMMSAKRARKVTDAHHNLEKSPNGDTFLKGVDTGIIGWGSTLGAIEEARRRLGREGIEVGVAHLRHLNPLPTKQIIEWMKPLRRIIVAEENRSGQLGVVIQHLLDGKFESLVPIDDFEINPELLIDTVKKIPYHLQVAVAR